MEYYRKPVFLGGVAIRVPDLIREICRCLEVEINKGDVSKDHVHLFLSKPPYHITSVYQRKHRS